MSSRRSGRTTRMLLRSILEFLEGNDVVIVAHNIEYAHQLKITCLSVLQSLGVPATPSRNNEIRFNDNRLIFISRHQRDKLRGLPIKVNYDHYISYY